MSPSFLARTLSLLTLSLLVACGATPEPVPDTGSDSGPDVSPCGPDPSETCMDVGCPDGQACVEIEDGCGPSSCFCEDDGSWACTADCGPDFQCVSEAAGCPTTPPGESCSDEGLSCDYGSECCCGDCFSSMFCDCSDGSWVCGATDACLVATCEGDTCESDEDCVGGWRESLCIDGVCTEPSTGSWSTGPDIPLGGECDDGPADEFELEGLAIDDQTLVVTLSYSGGCETHEFQACWDGSFMESFPVQARIGLQHNGHGDACEAWITEELRIPLSSMRESYVEGYGEGPAEIIIGIAGSSIVFEFDACTGVELPECGPECADGAFEQCGEACDPAADNDCGNNIGDAMACVDGVWSCSVHPPLGMGCNLICR